ncbi:MAG: SDR family NAD(P)-dependent oxidoreductase [Acidimicrobiales bacterium]
METFEGKLAVVTGGGTGMGRELVRQLAAAASDVAMCDINADNMSETASIVAADGSAIQLTSHSCDVSDEAQVLAFRDAVRTSHDTDHVDLLFNNAGIGGGGSFVADDRANWERTYDICWNGVYYCARAFMDLLVRSESGALVNTSSINGFWASVGPDVPHTSYSAAKFAVKGFTEALIADFRVNAPHLSAHVVMPGHIGTSIAINSTAMHGGIDVVDVRKRLAARGIPVDQMTDDELEAAVVERAEAFRDEAPTTAARAATVILDGVLNGQWRILIGDDAQAIDELVRSDPWAAYEPDFIDRITAAGHLGGLTN